GRYCRHGRGLARNLCRGGAARSGRRRGRAPLLRDGLRFLQPRQQQREVPPLHPLLSERAARRREGSFTPPLLRRPADLVMVELGLFRPAWRGERIGGRVEGGQLKPYASRAEIERGALAQRDLELFWVDDPVDAFFLQIQGSGRVRLPDGSTARV